MSQDVDHLQRVIDLLSKMPGVGKKSAQRMAFRILDLPEEYAFSLADSIRALKHELKSCRQCFNLSSAEVCGICSDPKRESHLVCVVEDAAGIKNIDRSGGYRGLYHVLQGVLSPMHGVGPNELRVMELMTRLQSGSFSEVILALNPTVEGEATASYLADLVKPLDIAVSRIATGIPMGGSLDYCDDITMANALLNRRSL